MGSIGAPELLIILLVLLLLFGGAKLPKLARSLGEAKNEFERGTKHDGDGKQVETRVVEVPKAEPVVPPSDSVTMSKAELEKLIDERARRVVQPPDEPR
ncbi:MAG TPA: twin-arginine translocase TatA/TatE family subunit [Acidimicrobiales bacterium]|nr:twin-arginine translocase TatA/TatE family subunit [Acidimicrobiales bacterium]